jgi:site-specific DNA-methyltransferase (adenine-specific)
MRRKPPFRHPDADEVWGWAGSLKPACEPIVVARKPLSEGTVAANVLRHGTGAVNIDASRVATGESTVRVSNAGTNGDGWGMGTSSHINGGTNGRWPANVCHDGSPEVLAAFARFGERNPHDQPRAEQGRREGGFANIGAPNGDGMPNGHIIGDTGTAARFFKSCPWEPEELRFHFGPKADASERVGNHPTVKPVALMEWLVRLVTPSGGRILDPFCGTGSTLVAADRLGFDALGIEQDPQTVTDAHEKLRRMRARRMIGDVTTPAIADDRQGSLL